MIVVTRLNGTRFAVNPDLIERIHESPDTHLVTLDGAAYVVLESLAEVVELIADYRAYVLSKARDFPAVTGYPLSLVPPCRDRTTAPAPPHLNHLGSNHGSRNSHRTAPRLWLRHRYGACSKAAAFPRCCCPAPMILVFGATLAIGLAGNTLKDVLQAFKAVPGMFIGKTAKPQESIDQMVRFAEKARSEGLLSLEEEAASVKDPFLARALQNIADGTDAEDLRMQMEDEIDTKSRSDHAASKFFAVPRRLRPHRRHRRNRCVPDPRPGKPLHSRTSWGT